MSSEDQSTDADPAEDVTCDRCGSETFELKRVDEWVTLADSFVAFCAECGAFAGKLLEWGDAGDVRDEYSAATPHECHRCESPADLKHAGDGYLCPDCWEDTPSAGGHVGTRKETAERSRRRLENAE